MKLAALSCLTVASAAPVAASGQAPWPAAAQCSNISPAVQRQCIGRRVEAKEQALQQLYPQALAKVREGFARWGAADKRLNPRHLVRAHRDWRRFVDSNCTALGAFGGGSNSSISDRVTECHERALDERILIYRQLASGTFGQ